MVTSADKLNKYFSSDLLIGLFILFASAQVHAQELDFDPDVDGVDVRAMALQDDGKIIWLALLFQ